MKTLIPILIICFYGHISCSTGEVAQGEWLVVEDFGSGMNDRVPLLPQRKPLPKVGETFELSCGYDLSTIDRNDIRSIVWSTAKPSNNEPSQEIKEDAKERFSARLVDDGSEYKKILTVKNVEKSDEGRQFYCYALTAGEGEVDNWQLLQLTLEVSDEERIQAPVDLGEDGPIYENPDDSVDKHPEDPNKEVERVEPIDTNEDEPTETPRGDFVEVRAYPADPRRPISPVPLLPQRKPTPKLGESFSLTCGFSLSQIDRSSIKSVEWYTYKYNTFRGHELIPEDAYARFSSMPYNSGYEYGKILTVNNVKEEDNGRLFFCIVLTKFGDDEIYQQQSVRLRIANVEDNDPNHGDFP